MPEPSETARAIAEEVSKIVARHPGANTAFGSDETLRRTLDSIFVRDREFEQVGGIYFHLGGSAMETAEAFTKIHIEQYRETGRPSLPALAAHHLHSLGLSRDNPHYKAAILVAVRAEMEHAATPEYHNQHHYQDVTAHVAEFLKRNNQLADAGVPGALKLTPEEMADSITAALGHDLDHPGGKNALPGEKTPGDAYRLEERSFRAMEPLLREAGLDEQSIDDIHTMIRTTSPDGPHGILKAVAKAQQQGAPVEWNKIDPEHKFPELEVLADNPKLTARAAILEDADLGASAFEGMASNKKMSEALTAELQQRNYTVLSGAKAGQPEDLKGPFAREGFSKYVVGDGPSSTAAQDAVGENYRRMRQQTEQEIAELAAKTTPKPAP